MSISLKTASVLVTLVGGLLALMLTVRADVQAQIKAAVHPLNDRICYTNYLLEQALKSREVQFIPSSECQRWRADHGIPVNGMANGKR